MRLENTFERDDYTDLIFWKSHKFLWPEPGIDFHDLCYPSGDGYKFSDGVSILAANINGSQIEHFSLQLAVNDSLDIWAFGPCNGGSG